MYQIEKKYFYKCSKVQIQMGVSNIIIELVQLSMGNPYMASSQGKMVNKMTI